MQKECYPSAIVYSEQFVPTLPSIHVTAHATDSDITSKCKDALGRFTLTIVNPAVLLFEDYH